MMMDARETRLPNGIRVLTASIPRVESVAVGLWVGAGSRHETARENGISHFMEHMLFKGTRKRSAKQISEAIEGRGGYINAFTQMDSTCYYARVASTDTWRALDVLSDMYLNPRLDPADIKKEAGVIIEEIMMYRDQPHQKVQDMLGSAMWVDHPVGRPVSGTPETVGAFRKGDFLDFKHRAYAPADTVFAFSGKLDHDKCVERVAGIVGKQRGSRSPSFKRVDRATGQTRIAIEAKDVEQAHLAMGIRLFGRNDKRRFALKLLNVILGENMSSRLFQTVREKHGMAYSIHSSASLLDETGILTIGAGLDKKRHDQALGLIIGEMKKFKTTTVRPGELKKARDYTIGQLRLTLESTTSQMMWIGENTLSYNRVISPEEAIESIEAVTARDIRTLANEFFKSNLMSIAILSQGLGDADRDRIHKHMRKL